MNEITFAASPTDLHCDVVVAQMQRHRMQGGNMGGRRDYETGSSDLETTSFVDSEDDQSR